MSLNCLNFNTPMGITKTYSLGSSGINLVDVTARSQSREPIGKNLLPASALLMSAAFLIFNLINFNSLQVASTDQSVLGLNNNSGVNSATHSSAQLGSSRFESLPIADLSTEDYVFLADTALKQIEAETTNLEESLVKLGGDIESKRVRSLKADIEMEIQALSSLESTIVALKEKLLAGEEITGEEKLILLSQYE